MRLNRPLPAIIKPWSVPNLIKPWKSYCCPTMSKDETLPNTLFRKQFCCIIPIFFLVVTGNSPWRPHQTSLGSESVARQGLPARTLIGLPRIADAIPPPSAARSSAERRSSTHLSTVFAARGKQATMLSIGEDFQGNLMPSCRHVHSCVYAPFSV